MLTVSVCNFWRKLVKKGTRKMLVKLAAGGDVPDYFIMPKAASTGKLGNGLHHLHHHHNDDETGGGFHHVNSSKKQILEVIP